VATESGEIATAVLVLTTKAQHISHAVKHLACRNNFNPKVLYSDAWPAKEAFWYVVFGGVLEGRLGLFHFEQRIISTLWKKHSDYSETMTLLLDAMYTYQSDDFQALISALKNGTLGDEKHSEEDIAELRRSRLFRQQYSKYLRKVIHPKDTMISMLDDWFVRYKTTASVGAQPARGRLDPVTQMPLYTMETKKAVEQCKLKAQYVQDLLPLEEMCYTIPPNPNSPHQLNKYLSKRAESKLESFHDNLAHFGNGGMNNSLADNLNLCGTARYNLTMRHKLRLAVTPENPLENPLQAERRRKIPTAWEDVVSYFNHSELAYINSIAKDAGVEEPPFSNVEVLPKDMGKGFFSEYLCVVDPINQPYNENDMCLCTDCKQRDKLTKPQNGEIIDAHDKVHTTKPTTTLPMRATTATNASVDANKKQETVANSDSGVATNCFDNRQHHDRITFSTPQQQHTKQQRVTDL